ncbi:MAG TPA: HlyD family efflux transporter periplasmic adaptor subunit [Steroidobacter sp.]|uniref:efflux RND transporter periplasmic adaptor subunit n=1 Tax=Steroidobacter sp. TaxID=1978227 RepID=UPI002ED981D5
MAGTNVRRMILWAPVALLLLAVLLWLFRPQPVAVDMAEVRQGAFQVTISDEGEARVRDVFVVSAPVAGLMRRVELKAGDHVAANRTEIARLEPSVPMFLDERAIAEARAGVDAASAATKFAQAQVRRAEAERDFAETELQRLRALASKQSISQNDLDAAERRAKTSIAAVAEAQASLRMRESEYAQAKARLLNPSQARGANKECDCVVVYSPVSGAVLRVLQESEAVVGAGTPILEIGDPANMEVRVDLLSEDAVRVRAGQRVLIESWGGPGSLAGVVRRVEPFAYTKVSALGIEEQRVNVLIDLTEPRERWRRLGHGYRVQPSIIVWEGKNTLQVPQSALFRDGEHWAVFVVENDEARLRHVIIGQHNATHVEIKSGVSAGERIVVHPNDRIEDGSLVEARSAA